MLTLINPTQRPEPFDHADWIFEAKFDGFRAAADTVRGRLISRTGNHISWQIDRERFDFRTRLSWASVGLEALS